MQLTKIQEMKDSNTLDQNWYWLVWIWTIWQYKVIVVDPVLNYI